MSFTSALSRPYFISNSPFLLLFPNLLGNFAFLGGYLNLFPLSFYSFLQSFFSIDPLSSFCYQFPPFFSILISSSFTLHHNCPLSPSHSLSLFNLFFHCFHSPHAFSFCFNSAEGFFYSFLLTSPFLVLRCYLLYLFLLHSNPPFLPLSFSPAVSHIIFFPFLPFSYPPIFLFSLVFLNGLDSKCSLSQTASKGPSCMLLFVFPFCSFVFLWFFLSYCVFVDVVVLSSSISFSLSPPLPPSKPSSSSLSLSSHSSFVLFLSP